MLPLLSAAHKVQLAVEAPPLAALTITPQIPDVASNLVICRYDVAIDRVKALGVMAVLGRVCAGCIICAS